jgi:hypothetical protein
VEIENKGDMRIWYYVKKKWEVGHLSERGEKI